MISRHTDIDDVDMRGLSKSSAQEQRELPYEGVKAGSKIDDKRHADAPMPPSLRHEVIAVRCQSRRERHAMSAGRHAIDTSKPVVIELMADGLALYGAARHAYTPILMPPRRWVARYAHRYDGTRRVAAIRRACSDAARHDEYTATHALIYTQERARALRELEREEYLHASHVEDAAMSAFSPACQASSRHVIRCYEPASPLREIAAICYTKYRRKKPRDVIYDGALLASLLHQSEARYASAPLRAGIPCHLDIFDNTRRRV